MSLPTLLDPATLPTLLEAAMLVCFGVAWPVANLNMWRNRQIQARGWMFTLIILCGYLIGASAKLLCLEHGGALAPVFWLYVLNAGSVATNLGLQWFFRPRCLALGQVAAAA